jgi:outer membrane receptor protein involved in Fe transport
MNRGFALRATIGAILAAHVGSAFAQSAAGASQDGLQDVTITGSRIKRQDVDGVGPVAVLTAEDIAVSGVVSTEVLLQRLSASAGFAGNQTNAYWTSGGWGTAQVNLRGLGANRTLVLINGRRVVYGGTGANGAVDLNMIPTALIERMEVLKDGASALYGADAVAGVVNIVTKQEFDGLQFDVKFGQTAESDGEEIAADMTFGVQGERGSMIASLSYVETEEINMASRQACDLVVSGGSLVCGGTANTPGGRATFLTGPQTGQRINFNQTPGGNGNFYEPYSAAKHNVGYFQWLNAVNPVERTTIALLGHYDVAERVRLFTEVIYNNRQTNQIATPATLQEYYQPGVGKTAFNIPAAHPTNPTGQAIRLDRRRLVETDVRETFQETDTWRVVLGFDGSFGTDWNWDVSYNKGRNTGIDGSTNVANLQRVYETLFNCNGTTVPCGDYLGVGDISPAALKYIMFTRRDTGGNEQEAFSANINGKLWELPAGPIGFAAGAEHRKDTGWRDPDPLVVANIANTNQQDAIYGSIEADEVYAELSFPLLKDVPFVQRLEANAAARWSDYDLFGSDTNYKLGLAWAIVDSFRVRGTISTAFRVPNVPELFGGVSEGQLTTADPCSNYAARGPSSVIYQNCRAAGVPLNFVQLGNVIRTTTGGNRELEPEDADTWTAGIVWEPGFVPGLSTTLDYWDIKIDNSIQSIPGTQKLNFCYNSPGLSHPFCAPQYQRRDALTGEVVFLSAQPANIGAEEASGIDLGAQYRTDILGHQSAFALNVSHLSKYEVTAFPGAVPTVYDGFITGGRGSYTQWRGDLAATVRGEQWTAHWNMQYIGGADDINVRTGPGSSVSAVQYHNLQFGWEFPMGLTLAAGVDNAFDEDAPYVASWIDANTDTMTYDLMGRRWYMKATWRMK